MMCSTEINKGKKERRYTSTVEFRHVSIKAHDTSVTQPTLKMQTAKRCGSNSGITSPRNRHSTGPAFRDTLSGLKSGRAAAVPVCGRTVCNAYRHRLSPDQLTARNSLFSHADDSTGVSVGFGSTYQLLIIRPSLHALDTSEKWKYCAAVQQMFIDLNLWKL